ncbi:translational GTPase TypA [Gammaproteobacteria bacterium]|jgi:GTP-binding protein|nr:translational GTPase TypA [Gammaproteobacteria bacterium]|tara:strand:- start:1664 stop:3454 length:1791 start_codon:yes stop_codon:yes gene_type:complete
MNINNLRNIAIIAHVDHGKTTLVDKLLQQSGTLDRKNMDSERIMDSNDQEKERGITITAKNTSINWNDHLINIVDTPGHADFGGEVERALSMVDSVLLLVDAVDGPMPQTRFVTQKAFEKGLKPIVVINKVDRPDARPDWVLDQVFDLFDRLGGTDEQLDFPVIYASAIEGISGLEANEMSSDMTPLMQMILDKVPSPEVNIDGPLQLQISALDSNSYVGVIGIGRIKQGSVRPNDHIIVIDRNGEKRKGKVLQVMGYEGLERIEVLNADAGSIVCITGIDKLNISDTICHPSYVEALPPLSVDEPTVSMTFQVNDSPFAGREGKFVTSRNIKERLDKELISNVALRVSQGDSPDKFIVSGRGELHLSVLIETMRREGFELAISKPQVIQKEVGEEIHEPYEQIVIDVEEIHQGSVMEELGPRKAELQSMEADGKGRIKLEFIAPSRGIIGFRSHFLTITSGTGIMTSVFDHYGPVKVGEIAKRTNGVMYSMMAGKTLAYALFNLQNRGKLFLGHGKEVYIGQIVGLHSRDNDLPVNPTKAKQLTNIRAAGTDENLILVPHIKHTLEQALEFIEDDELVEVTPESIRLRKKGKVRT